MNKRMALLSKKTIPDHLHHLLLWFFHPCCSWEGIACWHCSYHRPHDRKPDSDAFVWYLKTLVEGRHCPGSKGWMNGCAEPSKESTNCTTAKTSNNIQWFSEIVMKSSIIIVKMYPLHPVCWYIGTTRNDENDKALLGAQRALAHFVVWYPWRGLCHRRFEATKEYQKLVGEQSHRIYGWNSRHGYSGCVAPSKLKTLTWICLLKI